MDWVSLEGRTLPFTVNPSKEEEMVELTYLQLQEKFGNQFVARLDGQVICSGKTFEELVQKMKAQGVDETKVILEYIEPKGEVVVY